jgi:hypothetical protein
MINLGQAMASLMPENRAHDFVLDRASRAG